MQGVNLRPRPCTPVWPGGRLSWQVSLSVAAGEEARKVTSAGQPPAASGKMRGCRNGWRRLWITPQRPPGRCMSPRPAWHTRIGEAVQQGHQRPSGRGRQHPRPVLSAVLPVVPPGLPTSPGRNADRDRAWTCLDAQFVTRRTRAAIKFEADLPVEPDPELLALRDLGEGRLLGMPDGDPAERSGPLDRVPGRYHP
jgi:hypothetical protein